MDNYLNLEYPYYSLFYKLNKKIILEKVKNFIPEIYHDKINSLKHVYIEKYKNIENNYEYFIIKDIFKKTSFINNITDYFSEPIRIKCNFKKYLSPYNYWNKKKEKILLKTIKKYRKLSIYNIRETIFYNTKLCNNFRITVALAILSHFKPKKWLDISAGWGDRLLSAIFYNIKLYVSCDPNMDLHKCYDNMIKTFVPKYNQKNFIIYQNGFLEAPIENSNFDIIFSSPPFFDLEIYSNFKENSVKQYSDEKSWCDYFFIKSLIKAYNLLKKDGYIILYMGGSKYIMDKMHLLNNIMDYRGQIYFYEKTERSIYVWKKINNKKINSLE